MRLDQKKNRRLAFPDPDDRCGFYAYLARTKIGAIWKSLATNIQAGGRVDRPA